MAGTTRLELATSAVTEFIRWTQRNQSDTAAIVGNRRAYWVWSEGFCATVCATPPLLSTTVQLRPHLCRENRRVYRNPVQPCAPSNTRLVQKKLIQPYGYYEEL